MPVAAYTLYGNSISLYTGKVRAYLRFKNLPFVEQTITPAVIEEIGSFIIPVLETPAGDLVQDTTEIIDFLENRLPGASIYPEDPVQKLCALILEVYGDEWLKIPAMHYRWKYNSDYIFREFGKIFAPYETQEQQLNVGRQTSAAFRAKIPLLGINAESEGSIEAWYEELLGQMNLHFANREYFFGSRPSIADYGFMGPLYAHNYRDPWSGSFMRKFAPNVARWVDMMNTPNPNAGDFEKSIGVTLQPVMKRIFLECIPAMVATCDAVANWLDQNPNPAEIPREIGMLKARIGDVTVEKSIHPYHQWMFQRPLNYYQSLTGSTKIAVDSYLKEVGGFDSMQTQLRYTLAREKFKLLVKY